MNSNIYLEVLRYRISGVAADFFHVYIKNILAGVLNYVAIGFHLLGNKINCSKYLMAAARYGYGSVSIALFKRYRLLNKDALYPQVSKGVGLDEAAMRSIVIRWPEYEDNKVKSKGILIITFTKVFSFYIHKIDINKLSEHFLMVLEPSWSGYFDADILSWSLTTKDPVFIEASELRDRVTLNALTNNLIPLSFGASDWVDYNAFREQEVEKKYDSVYVANTNHIKRVIRYIKAIKKISNTTDPDYKGCLVCASWGGEERVIRFLPKYFGVEGNLDLQISLKKYELNKILNSSKVNILLSYKEGSNRSLFESMFVNIPVICISENIGVNKSYINEYTGLLIPDRFLEDGLLYMKDNWEKYRPKKWAVANISPERTTEKLLDILEGKLGEANSSDVYIKTNNPEVAYLNYPGIEFTDINKALLGVFMEEPSRSMEESEYAINKIQNCHQEFLNRLANG